MKTIRTSNQMRSDQYCDNVISGSLGTNTKRKAEESRRYVLFGRGDEHISIRNMLNTTLDNRSIDL